MPDQSSAIDHGAAEAQKSSARLVSAFKPPTQRPPETVDRAELAEQRRMFALTATCLATVLAGWIGRGSGLMSPEVALGFYLVAYVTGGWYPVLGTVTALRRRTMQ